MAWKSIVARSFSAETFPSYVAGLRWINWRPTFLTVHNTAVPSLTQRPSGFSLTHIRNLERYYRDEKGWSSSPHLFIDDRQIWAFNPLTMTGTHSPGFNAHAIGIEMLGDYARESFTAGRGLLVRRHTVVAMAALNRALGFTSDNFKYHVEDSRTSHNCPGVLARACRAEMTEEIRKEMEKQNADARAGRIPRPQPLPDEDDVDADLSEDEGEGDDVARGTRWERVKRWLWAH